MQQHGLVYDTAENCIQVWFMPILPALSRRACCNGTHGWQALHKKQLWLAYCKTMAPCYIRVACLRQLQSKELVNCKCIPCRMSRRLGDMSTFGLCTHDWRVIDQLVTMPQCCHIAYCHFHGRTGLMTCTCYSSVCATQHAQSQESESSLVRGPAKWQACFN